jgi:hypothetical protein
MPTPKHDIEALKIIILFCGVGMTASLMSIICALKLGLGSF